MTADLPTHPSTEAVGEVRRPRPPADTNWLRESREAYERARLTEIRDPATNLELHDEILKLRSDLAAMTSDRDWLRGEFEKASAEAEKWRAQVDEDHEALRQVHADWVIATREAEAVRPVVEALREVGTDHLLSQTADATTDPSPNTKPGQREFYQRLHANMLALDAAVDPLPKEDVQ